MKINSLIAKTALAAAIAGVSFAASAKTIKLETGVAGPVVLANEIFGASSNTTLVQLPELVFDATAAGNIGDLSGVPATSNSTIKLTLGGTDTVFGEVYDDPANWSSQNIDITVGGTPLDGSNSVVTAGGTKNDNQITIGLNLAGSETLDNITISGLKVQGLKASLERNAAQPVRSTSVTLEVREDATDSSSPFDNTPELPVIYSIDGITLEATPTNYTAPAAPQGRLRINVANAQEKYTLAGGVAASSDFAEENSVTTLDFGSVTIERNGLSTDLKTVAPAAGAYQAGKEDGTLFDFTGSDTVTLKVTGTADLANYGDFYLDDGTGLDSCSGNKVPSTVTKNGNEVSFKFADNAVISKTMNLCADASGTKRIPESGFSAELNVGYYSARYTDSYAFQDMGPVLRNGCQVTLFNVPNVNAADKAFVRFTNTSGMSGQVNAYVWTQDGQQKDVDAEVLASLSEHATEIFHTDSSNPNGVYLGDVMPEFAQTGGRSRLVLQGAFPSCEALGMVRSPNGTLVNVTSTTYSDGINNLQENGTSNTSN